MGVLPALGHGAGGWRAQLWFVAGPSHHSLCFPHCPPSSWSRHRPSQLIPVERHLCPASPKMDVIVLMTACFLHVLSVLKDPLLHLGSKKRVWGWGRLGFDLHLVSCPRLQLRSWNIVRTPRTNERGETGRVWRWGVPEQMASRDPFRQP